MGLFKRKAVPSELPELALDDLESGNKEVHDHLKQEEAKKTEELKSPDVNTKLNTLSSPTQDVSGGAKKEESVEVKKETVDIKKPQSSEPTPVVKPTAEKEVKTGELKETSAAIDEKSFFGDLQNDLKEEISDFNQFESWYKDKFEKRDVIKDMKSYWENQKTDSIIKILGKNFQEKISGKILKLQELEKIWQTAYFELVEKEEEIKEQELELKELLAEFVKICKSKKEGGEQKVVKKEISTQAQNKTSLNSAKKLFPKSSGVKKASAASTNKNAAQENAKTKKVN
ncbi:MAG: hypothetical protein PVJ67_03100 [Candidatus Pacearchaeota archaeon]